jgi:acyl carrier protein
MTNDEVLQKLTTVFRDVFDDNGLQISATTTAADVPGWDSLMHVNLIAAVEKAFRVTFTTKEVKGLSTVDDLVRLTASRAR